MLEESNNDWYLVSTRRPRRPARFRARSTRSPRRSRPRSSPTACSTRVLLGATQQISCSSCARGFASVGSFAAGAQGRWGLSDELTLIGGFSYNQWYASGITVENAPTVAGSLVYDLWKWGESRPFFEVGGALTPYEDVHYTRYYPNGYDDRGRQRLGDRPRPLAVRAGGLDRPAFPDRRGGGLRRS